MEKSCGLVVFNSNKILLLKYSANNTQGEGGHWDFPKGHVEQNETELETALRELEEETGISKVEIIADFRHSISYTFSRRSESISKEVIFFLDGLALIFFLETCFDSFLSFYYLFIK